MTPSANPIQDRAEELLQAGITGMTLGGGAPEVSLVAAGDHAWDSCCGGAVWVRIVRHYTYTEVIDIPATGTFHCDGGLAVQLELVALRCAPPAPTKGGAKGVIEVASFDSATEESAAAVLHADAYQIVQAVRQQMCAWADEDLSASMTEWIPLGPEGGCLGGALTVTVDVS